jgi:hypothetical protein
VAGKDAEMVDVLGRREGGEKREKIRPIDRWAP